LSQGVLVIEGESSSGAMITARRAIEQGRQVFAIPGQIDDASSDGPNELIREGAYTVLCTDDILTHYEFLWGDVIDRTALEKAKRKIADSDCDRALKKYGVFSRKFLKAQSDQPEDEKSFELEAKRSETASENKAETHTEKQSGGESLADQSAQMLSTLDEFTRRVFEALPIDKAVSPDALAAQGMDIGAAITSLTMLELYGLVSSLPGGLYVRK
jgi:predicted Rossmann fold nucleotide-binding protein DprA/Smf involved in DNA uptake